MTDDIMRKLGRAITSKNALRSALSEAFGNTVVTEVFSDLASLVDKLPGYHDSVVGHDYCGHYSSSNSSLVANVHSIYFRLGTPVEADALSSYFLGDLQLGVYLRENTNGVPATGAIYAKIESYNGDALSSASPAVNITDSDYSVQTSGKSKFVTWSFRNSKALTPGVVYRISFYKAGDASANVGIKLVSVSTSVPDADRHLWPGGFGDTPAYAVLGRVIARGGVVVRSQLSSILPEEWTPAEGDYTEEQI